MRYQSVNFLARKLKQEIRGESSLVPFCLLVQLFRCNAVQGSKVRIQDDLLASNEQDSLLDSFDRDN
jgi:hypothetical protein